MSPDVRIAAAKIEKRSRERNPLAFATGKAHPTLSDAGLIALRQVHNEIVRIGSLGRSHDLRLASVGTGIRNILGDAG